MRAEIQKLSWDSDFFGFAIGKIEFSYDESINIELLKKRIDSSNFKLISVFVSGENENVISALRTTGEKPIDEKIIFSKELSGVQEPMCSNVSYFNDHCIPEALYKLTFDSGLFSRYNIDSNFEPGSYERFYSIWLENSIWNQFADKVFVYKEDDNILGFITLKISNSVGAIGLLAVDSKERGKGIGSKLIQACETHLKKMGVFQLDVATQKANANAVQFYLRNSFVIAQTINIYHIWRK